MVRTAPASLTGHGMMSRFLHFGSMARVIVWGPNRRHSIHPLGSMSYYRLRDIKTPPFAYVLNRADAVRTCHGCQMPLEKLAEPLKVEICVGQPELWQDQMAGQPLMADHWLIGDAAFGETLASLLGDEFGRTRVQIANWLTSEPTFGQTYTQAGNAKKPPVYYHYFPIRKIDLADEVLQQFQPIQCFTCRRNIPNIPFHLQPLPSLADPVPFASLRDFLLEGFDYLFHTRFIEPLANQFPNMVLEKLSAPSYV